MGVSKDKVATRIVMPKELKPQLEQLAKSQNRSLNNFMVTVLQEYTAKQKNQNENKESSG